MTVVSELLKRSCLSLISLEQAPDKDRVCLGDVIYWWGCRKSETRIKGRPMSRCISEVTAMNNRSDCPRASQNLLPKGGGSIIYPLVSSPPPMLNVATTFLPVSMVLQSTVSMRKTTACMELTVHPPVLGSGSEVWTRTYKAGNQR